jgi:hypothetical protein
MLMDETQSPAFIWFFGVACRRVDRPAMNAAQSAVAIETLEITRRHPPHSGHHARVAGAGTLGGLVG